MKNANQQPIDPRSQFEDWMDLWDDMRSQEPSKPKIEPAPYSAGATSSAQDCYYDYLDSDPELLQEAKTPNPVYPDSVGPDCDAPNPVWAEDDLVKEIVKLKERLFQVGNEVAKMGIDPKNPDQVVSKQDNKLMSEVESIRKQIEKISSQLGIKEEPSPWNV